ncbi:cell division protein FtsB [Sulfuricella sp. T08]|uniref:cell division protein FtsB n=1 Tax=Sulfuricella sp. T08 TaxID=1632857 RepID=UPI00061797BF|nr:cell division protein FtsB [Sulfuricella sp. T08]GAO35753.1 cell division protein FtsB [Sulfuricella sp. T08]
MRWLTLIFVVLIAALQYPLWLGKGSWLRVWEVDRESTQQKEVNLKLRARNASLDAEVRDLKQGYDAIEERARSELGMIKRDEIFFQVLEESKPAVRAQPEVEKKAAPQVEEAKP